MPNDRSAPQRLLDDGGRGQLRSATLLGETRLIAG
jgi:hypothetical protein